MAAVITQKAPPAPKQPAIYKGVIAPAGRATGIIVAMAGKADLVSLVVLNSIGDVVSDDSRPVASSEQGAVSLSFKSYFIESAQNEIYFLVVKGFLKGGLVWESRLGRFQFPA